MLQTARSMKSAALVQNVESQQVVKLSFNSYSEGIDFSRQNLTSVDARFWQLKWIPAL